MSFMAGKGCYEALGLWTEAYSANGEGRAHCRVFRYSTMVTEAVR